MEGREGRHRGKTPPRLRYTPMAAGAGGRVLIARQDVFDPLVIFH